MSDKMAAGKVDYNNPTEKRMVFYIIDFSAQIKMYLTKLSES
jgi:hypothetical protein